VPAEARAAVRGPAVEPLAALARRDRHLAVRGALVPVLLVVRPAGVVIRERLEPVDEHALAVGVPAVVELAVYGV
jgi:hypothetical protein